MIDTNSISAFLASNTIKTVAKTASVATVNVDPKELSSKTDNADTATLSTLAKQLNDSAARAESRDSTLSSKELEKLATSIIYKIAGTEYDENRKVHDAEIPDTDDPELLERARQATQFKNGTGANPFASLSQDQLRLIIYDESGDYTINERSAAFSENYDREEVWNKAMAKKYVDEYNETGKSTNTLVEMLAHYNDLPPIEKAQYPSNYVANLTAGDSSALDIFNSGKNSAASVSDSKEV
ncbi:hypothetical protein K5D34_17070 [Pseudomonas cichorii]|nr:hypothetical protein [Pseudomonas cichorii]MBX8511402.1 hypothetical protein [Pseudomonas cichorii]MBX8526373.1 hypothetical protein [Pseudomonas cichorii]MBX8571305.1 hypothetical protein [Pseudomonas cichorii]